MTSKSRTKTYASWSSMKKRCLDPKNASYSRYGKRGITFQESWSEFDNFLADMGERPDGKTLDRLNNNKPYSKENCRWATPKEQASNRSLPSIMKSRSIKGVYLDRNTNTWYAQIQRNLKVYCLGHYSNFFDACCARKSAEYKSGVF